MSAPHPASSKTPPAASDDIATDVTVVVDSIGTLSTPTRSSGGVSSSSLLIQNDGWINDKFRLLEKLGEGGFGLVFKAEQVQPIHRLVAVKILKPGMDTRQVIARFDTERQSLARMEHPNIARVLDAGETERGLPYFVMELVRGKSITSYCREHSLNLQQRIELFLPVCAAVHHAHQKGIIHRDLKPSNVLVMEEDGAPVPKVIDFGIAKLLEPKDISQSLDTGMNQLVGTPGYISPEQIEFGSSHVDTRSDVYALGSILMELLTGKALVTPMDLTEKPLHQILRDQAERDPPKPSSREPSLKGDLDWIILKALERDPNRRYGSADELANDLRRHLHHQPVIARPPSRRYLIGKFVRRHRVGVAAGVAIALAVLAGGITSTALYFDAEQNRKAAMRSREDLRQSYSRSDEQMARQLTERTDYPAAVAWLCRALRTDKDNQLAATNLLSLLSHVHLLHQTTTPLSLPNGAREARMVALSRPANRAVAVSSTSLTGSADAAQQTLSIWDLKSFARRDRVLPKQVIATCLKISPDGRTAFVAQDNGQVEVIPLKNEAGSMVLQPALPSSVLDLIVSGDSNFLAAGGEDGTIHVWDVRQPHHPAQILKQQNAVTTMAINDAGAILATACYEGKATVWDRATGKPIAEPLEVDEGLARIAIHPQRDLIAIGQSGVVHVGNFRTGQEVIPALIHAAPVTALSINGDGTTITVGDAGGYLYAWDLSNGQPRFPGQFHDGEIVHEMESAEQGLIASVSRHGEVQVWNPANGMRIQHRLQHSVASVSVTEDCSMLALAPKQKPFVQIWSICERMTTRRFLAQPDEAVIQTPAIADNAPEPVKTALAHGWNRSGNVVACVHDDGEVTVFDLKTKKPVGPSLRHSPAVGAVAVSDDGRLAVTSGRDREVRIWDVASGQPKGIALRHQSFVEALALSADAQRLVTVTDQGEIRVWDVTTGECLTPGIREGSGIDRIAISADGHSIQYRNTRDGWFSLPMPAENVHLPDWFLNLAEALARQRLSNEGKTEALTLEDFIRIAAQVPANVPSTEQAAVRWARWLLANPDDRSLHPLDDQPFAAYLKALQDQKSAAAEHEIQRYRPQVKPRQADPPGSAIRQ